MHIAIAAPIATEHVAELLEGDTTHLPQGYTGAPFTGVLITQLLKLGHKVSAFTTDSALYPAPVIKASGRNFDFYICPERPRAWRFNGLRIGRALDGFGYETKMLAQLIRDARPDIIHAHWTYEFALAAINTGLPHLISCHDAPQVILRFNPYPFRAIRYWMARRVYAQGQHFTTVSDYMVSQVQRYTPIPIQVIPNPLADFVLAMGKPRSTPQTRRIGLVCNGWEARKNCKPALQAFAQFRKLDTEAELHLFGYDFGTDEQAQQWCKQQGLQQGMIFHGATAHKALIQQLNQLDVLLHPSLEESFGVVLAEAMALGLPLVAGKNSGAVPWVVGYDQAAADGCCAVLTDVADVVAIYQALCQVFDADYYRRSEAAYLRAQSLFAAETITNTYVSCYQHILAVNHCD